MHFKTGSHGVGANLQNQMEILQYRDGGGGPQGTTYSQSSNQSSKS